MADKVLARQVKARVEQSAEPFEGALRTVPELEAGRLFGEHDGPHGDERTSQRQISMSQDRADERHRDRAG